MSTGCELCPGRGARRRKTGKGDPEGPGGCRPHTGQWFVPRGPERVAGVMEVHSISFTGEERCGCRKQNNLLRCDPDVSHEIWGR